MFPGRALFWACELEGIRLLSPPPRCSYMTSNHLPGGVDLETFGRPLFAETPFPGVGFGLGFGVTIDPGAGKVSPVPRAIRTWGGALSTSFWVDPAEELTVSFFTQLLPSSSYPIRSQLRSAGLPGARGLRPSLPVLASRAGLGRVSRI